MKRSANTVNVAPWRFVILTLSAAFVGLALQGLAAEAESGVFDADGVNRSVRSSLFKAANYLKSQVETYGEWDLLVVPEKRLLQKGAEIIGYSYVTNYVSMQTLKVKRPIFKEAWSNQVSYFEEFESWVVEDGISVGEDSKMKKVQRRRPILSPAHARDPNNVKTIKRRIKVKRVVGYREEEIQALLPDPNGESRLQKVPIKKLTKGYGEWWDPGLLGQNAMALVAMLKCGIPENDPQLDKLAASLHRAIDLYKLPDTTWDLAWLAAAFANLEDRRYAETRDEAIAKLLRGQVTEGPARGLWGPVCINTRALASALKVYQGSNKGLESKKKRLQELQGRDRKRVDPRIRRLEEEIAVMEGDARQMCEQLARQGLRSDVITDRFQLAPFNTSGEIPVVTHGLPYFIYNQTLADMESTAIAVYALREAAERGCLPAGKKGAGRTGVRRLSSQKSSDGIAAEPADVVLVRTAEAIASAQRKDGSWNERNIHQANSDFHAINIPAIQDREVVALPSSDSIVSNARAYAALRDIGMTVGPDKIGRYDRPMQAADGTVLQDVSDFLDDRVSFESPLWGHYFEQEEYCFHLRGLYMNYGSSRHRKLNLWRETARTVIRRQHGNGSWGNEDRAAIKPSSEWKLIEDRAREKHNALMQKYREGVRKTFDRENHYLNTWLKITEYDNRAPFESSIVSTVYAMLFLLDGVQPPAIAYAGLEASRLPPVVKRAVDVLKTKDRIAATHMVIPVREKQSISWLPAFLHLADDRLLSDSQYVKWLKQYLGVGGVIVADLSSPTAARLPSKLSAMFSDGKPKALPADYPLLANFAGPMPELTGIFRHDGRLSVLLLPWGKSKKLSANDAVRTIYTILRNHARATYSRPEFPMLTGKRGPADTEGGQLLGGAALRPARPGKSVQPEADESETKADEFDMKDFDLKPDESW
jgi:hypothetical protein